ncbi:hypothetical protein BN7_4867 [Wickerhamomyces ciferrii]|uniref:Uncharacterized protein n=1 Tax=Wickerhamomyces ciferrii (strain ATCC 14091 / BCRC 22168 / CBS 111 / JCM 3599 / NBRC 0793 / NRRL Y-1031 F-60-10) TaxID=1206466 RepID=K0KJ94_WICCF|nr:uncharacterized protein BN7_4867 [Wickerhamomyces ciferrii]CCH45285.1 hypothetical protein BN7_4867 [Wickerhamomyces ciferrii]
MSTDKVTNNADTEDQSLLELRINKFVKVLLKVVSAERVVKLLKYYCPLAVEFEVQPTHEEIADFLEVYYLMVFKWHFNKNVSWRIKSLGFVLRFHTLRRVSKFCNIISGKARNCFKVLKRSFKNLTKKTEHSQKQLILKNLSDKSKNPVTGFKSGFPVEIWMLLVDFGLDAGNLVRVNTELFSIFAPRLYKSIHMDIVLSSLNPLKSKYSHYLKHGGNYPHHASDPFKIFESYKDSTKYDYEFLDIVHRGCNDKVVTSMVINDQNAHVRVETRVIREFKKVQQFFDNVIMNENSILRKFNKELSSNVFVLDGFTNLIEDSNKLGIELQKLSQNSNLNVMRYDSDVLNSFGYSFEYEDFIRDDKPFGPGDLEFMEEMDAEQTAASKLLPECGFYKELLHLGIQFDEMKSNFSSRRELSNLNDVESVKELDPIKSWNQSLPRFWTKDAVYHKGPENIEVDKRLFCTEENTLNFLIKFMDPFTLKDHNSERSTSLLFSAQVCDERANNDTTRHGMMSIVPQNILINRFMN